MTVVEEDPYNLAGELSSQIPFLLLESLDCISEEGVDIRIDDINDLLGNQLENAAYNHFGSNGN